MSKKDILTKKYMRNPRIFADFFNGYIYDGQEQIDSRLDRFINDYDIHLFSIIDLEKIPDYRTELRALFAFLNKRNDGRGMTQMVSEDEAFRHIDRDTAELMREFGNVKLPRKNKDGEYDMCKAVIEIENMGIEKGEILGREKTLIESIKNLMSNTKQSYDEVCKLLGLSETEANKLKSMI